MLRTGINRRALGWDDEKVKILQEARVDRFPARMRKLAFSATIYHVSQERNNNIYQHCAKKIVELFL